MSSSQSVRKVTEPAEHSVAWHVYMEQKSDAARWQQLPFTAIINFEDVLCEWRMCRVCGQYLHRAIKSVSVEYPERTRQSKKAAQRRSKQCRPGKR